MFSVAGVCSGAGGFDLAFERAGFDVLWNCESDKSCQRVLVERFESVVLQFEDMTQDDILTAPAPRVFVGGTPCQGFSVAGLRKGLNDDRSNLALRFLRLCDHFNPEVILWENVPGVLSDKENAFGCFLAGLVGADAPLVPPTECGGRWTNAGVVAGPKRTAAWRILDSQYFGVAQRRERVFVVASPRAELPFQILFEPEGVRRHSPPSREAGQRVAPTIEGRAGRSGCNSFATSGGLAEIAGTLGGSSQSGGFRTTDLDQTGAFIPIPIQEIGKRQSGNPMNGVGHGKPGDPMFTLQSSAVHGIAFQSKASSTQSMNPSDISPTLDVGKSDGVAVAFHENQRGEVTVNDTVGSLKIGGNKPGQGYPAVAQGYAVRRLTPRECERLQDFPDDWTLVPNAKGKPMADGPRYKMMGNAVTVSTVEWIARRIHSCLSIAANRSIT